MKSVWRNVAGVLALGVGIGGGYGLVQAHGVPWASAQVQLAQQVQAQRSAEERTVIQVARQATPAVVSVSTGRGSGSGVIIRQDGVILTNAHVVGNAQVVQIGLADGRRLQGRVLGRDPTVDIAVVRIAASSLPVAPIADSDRLEVGQAAIAIGNPLGLERTVTTGIVSAINRELRGLGADGLIQTDAAINSGNSGGPLLDSGGRVIGINTAVLGLDPRQPATGLGFAVPINLANDVAQQLLTTGRVQRAFLGIDYRDIEAELAAQFRLPVREGIIVTAVVQGTPAAAAGLGPGDIITRIGNTPITRGGDLRRLLRELPPGSVVNVQVVRPSGTSTLRARLGQSPVV
ncbi:MAG: trypsin-like peptidase domain-containing protein [Gemmatimonadota bacterium]|nr:trypsin-like peptidase domain-containing protein [Gemmatimonadota bacterium]